MSRRLACFVCSLTLAQSAGADVCKPTSSATDHHGKVLRHLQVQVIYWGNTFGTTATPAKMTGAFQDICNGPFFWSLNEYGNIGPVRLIPFTDTVSTNPTNPLTDAKIFGTIDAEITAGRVALPRPGLDMLYVVVTPPGFHDADNDAGWHYYHTYSNGARYYYAQVGSDGTMSGTFSAASTFDHEVGEAATDPEPDINPAWTPEIGDACGACVKTINGYSVQSLWSQRQQRCIAPRAWRGVFQYTGSGNWSQLFVGPSQQIYAMNDQLIVTDNASPSNLWQALPNIQRIGVASGSNGFGSMFAISNMFRYAISMDQSTLSRFDPVSSTWTNIVTNGATSVYAGSNDTVAMVWPGNNHTWVQTNRANNTWTDVDGLSTGHVITGQRLFDINLNHDRIFSMPVAVPGPAHLTVIGNVADILGGPNLMAFTQWSDTTIWTFNAANDTIFKNGSVTPYMLASAGGSFPSNLFGLTGGTGSMNVTQSSNPLTTLPPWSQFASSPAMGRLVSGGNTLFAASDPGCTTTTNATCP